MLYHDQSVSAYAITYTNADTAQFGISPQIQFRIAPSQLALVRALHQTRIARALACINLGTPSH